MIRFGAKIAFSMIEIPKFNLCIPIEYCQKLALGGKILLQMSHLPRNPKTFWQSQDLKWFYLQKLRRPPLLRQFSRDRVDAIKEVQLYSN